jgi:hypothetical protein
MRRCQRKTLVKKENWPLIERWYWCPASVIDANVNALYNNHMSSIAQLGWPLWWNIQERIVSSRLAHACDDGGIRAPWVETYKRKDNVISIYGKCRKCDTPLSDEIKAIIILEYIV